MSLGGWVYFGSQSAEPSLINPSLSVKAGTTIGLGYYPSYSRMDPVQRYTYLLWLSQGRNSPNIDIGYVFVYFYGLERRILTHLLNTSFSISKMEELEELTKELERLRDIYSKSSGSFDSYSTDLLETIEYAKLSFGIIEELDPAPLSDRTYDVPLSLRAAIGKYSEDQTPIPAKWALRWAWYFPETNIRTPAKRLPTLFERLFTIRYHQLFGEGMIARPAKRQFEVGRTPANVSVRNASLQLPTITNTFELKRSARLISKLFDDVTTELDLHSRWIGRNTNNSDHIGGLATVPQVLIVDYSESIGNLDSWLQSNVTSDRAVLIDAESVFSQLPQPPTGDLNNADSAAFAYLLGALGVGVEPETRIAGPSIRAKEKLALFRTQIPTQLPQSTTFDIASLILHLAVVVSSADGKTSPEEVSTLSNHLRANLETSEIEEQRLFAHLLWLSNSGVKLTGIKRRLTMLDSNQRESIGELLIAVAVSDTSLLPSEVRALNQIFKLLGLDVDQVHSRLHMAITTDASTAEPDTGLPTSHDHKLDPTLLQRTQDETLAVSKILAKIFEEETATDFQPSVSEVSTEAIWRGLDDAHGKLLSLLFKQERWDAEDFQALCDNLRLIPLGAIDVINEFSIDSVEEVIIESDDTGISINSYAKEELINV